MAAVGDIHGERVALLAKPREIFVTSAYLYPLKGFYFCVRHSFMWPLFRTRFIPCLIVSLVVLPTLFIVAYLPQVAFLAIFQGNLAWFNAVFLVLGEAAAIIALLFEAFFVDETLVKIFDAVLIHQGFPALVANRRTLVPNAPDAVQQLGKATKSAIYSPFSFRLSFEYLFFLPLTFIPLGGGPLYCLVLGRRAGPFHHYRYFKLLGLDERQRNEEARKRRWKYTWFGMVALLLQLVPVFCMLFLLTTSAGAALWAADLERKKTREREGGPTIPVEV
ncbi:hypothetical protein MIND_00290500 [Mycena indigotica]|uniref:Uncharacterized protein n=1 Tax=Mycena indigotica TaxID=2126181 RepID=A0A8H6T8K8_9AGAR|nr:uncharacterized protein MIND_00290500 [Mycena indigotica]KAF7312754.1 hypothetical protein MIND_00290500 [Mycena indigotica]